MARADTLPPMGQPPDILRKVSTSFQSIADTLNSKFLDKQEIVRLMCISAIAGEHLVIVGPPGTAKSALVRSFSELLKAKYFEYLLTRFTEPNELFGPVDIHRFREGAYERRVEGMLPESEIVFMDEIFKANSAILNSLLHVINERVFVNGRTMVKVPLISVFAASNEVPTDDNLQALFDRFLLRTVSENLDSYHFLELLTRGGKQEMRKMTQAKADSAILDVAALRELHQSFDEIMNFSTEFLTQYKSLIFQIRSEGIAISDRRIVKMMKLFAASAAFEGRNTPNAADFFLLRHIWNVPEQAELLDSIVNPVVDQFIRDNPGLAQPGKSQASLEDLVSEVELIRTQLTKGEELSDIQLFSLLKNLNDIKNALTRQTGPTAARVTEQVNILVDSVLTSSKFSV